MLMRGAFALIATAAALCAASADPPAVGVCGDPLKGPELQIALASRAVIENAVESDDWRSASDELDSLFMALVLRTKESQAGVLAECLAHARLSADMAALAESAEASGPEAIDRIAAFFLANPPLAGRWFMLRDPHRDDLPAAYALLGRMLDELGDKTVRDYFAVVAAACVVHDRPFERSINENKAAAGDPVEIVRYFIDTDARLEVSTRELSPELLLHVVNVTSTPADLAWALERYGNDRNLGNRFFEIAYDYDHYEQGKPKKVTASGRYSLPAIKQYGGVCADQAYFAESVGKAMGVPTAYLVGVGGEVSHAWLGFLQTRGRELEWNFDSGRYEAYKKVRGTITDPQTGATIPDCYLQLIAEWSMTSQRKIASAEALTAAAASLSAFAGKPAADLPELPAELAPAMLKTPRPADAASRLALLKEAVSIAPSFVPAWLGVKAMAEGGELDHGVLDEWCRALDRVCGRSYPDFTHEILESMFESVEDPRQRVELYEWAFGRVIRARPDLAAIIRLRQGEAFESVGDLDNAWRAFDDILRKFPNDTAMTPVAAQNAGRLLGKNNRLAEMVPHLDALLARLDRPDSAMMFRNQSNYYKVAQYKAAICIKIGDQAGAVEALRMLGN